MNKQRTSARKTFKLDGRHSMIILKTPRCYNELANLTCAVSWGIYQGDLAKVLRYFCKGISKIKTIILLKFQLLKIYIQMQIFSMVESTLGRC